MYGKIFESIYDGTLYGQWEAIVTMQQLIVLSDESGVVDMTPPAIAGKTSIPIDIIEKGIKILSEPDPYSRTPGNEGVRIVLIDDHKPWGWYLVNHEKYRDMTRREDKRKADRERIAAKRKLLNEKGSRTVSHGVANVAHEDKDKDTDKDCKKIGRVTSTARFDDWWKVYPKKVKKADARKRWRVKKLDPLADKLIADVENRVANDPDWLDGFIPHPTTYLNGERWDDEISTKQKAAVSDGFGAFDD